MKISRLLRVHPSLSGRQRSILDSKKAPKCQLDTSKMQSLCLGRLNTTFIWADNLTLSTTLVIFGSISNLRLFPQFEIPRTWNWDNLIRMTFRTVPWNFQNRLSIFQFRLIYSFRLILFTVLILQSYLDCFSKFRRMTKAKVNAFISDICTAPLKQN